MPIYEFRCNACEAVFESFRHANEGDPEECPQCKSTDVSKLMSVPSIQMMGRKWDSHPNSPDGIHQAKELRRKHSRNDTLNEWKAENTAKFNKDGQFSY